MFSLIQQQNDCITQAVVQNGEWHLRNGFKFLEVSSDSWHNLSEKQKKTRLDEDTIHTIIVVLHDDDSEVEEVYTCNHLSASYRDLLLPGHSNDADTGNMEEGRGAVDSARPCCPCPSCSCFSALHGGK